MPESYDRRRFLTGALRLGGAAALAHPLVTAGARVLGADLGVDLQSALPIASVPRPRIVTRREWGADESLRREAPSFAPVSKFVVHHTVTANDEDDPAARVRSIYRYHTLSRGWNDIGYNFLIDRQGRIYEGRYAGGRVPGEDGQGRGVIGAHCSGYNTGSIGIALLGTFTSDAPTSAAIEALISLIAWKADRAGVDPAGATVYAAANGHRTSFANVVGHRDLGSTSCPGGAFAGSIASVRHKAALRMSSGFIGYRILAADGHVGDYGGAADGGDLLSRGVPAGGVDMAAVPGGQGYWVLDEAGGVHTFLGAKYRGSIPELRRAGQRIGDVTAVAIEPTVTGNGYWITDRAGGVFTFGDARFRGSIPWLRQRGQRIGQARVVDMVATPSGNGYWLLDNAGGVFTFGDARFRGSIPWLRQRGQRIGQADVVAMAVTPSGNGYWMLDAAGGVFTFGDAAFRGSLPGRGVRGAGRAVGIVPSPTGNGYAIATADGSVHTFGDAPFYGRLTGRRAVALAPVIRR